jgi:hypothetical protein
MEVCFFFQAQGLCAFHLSYRIVLITPYVLSAPLFLVFGATGRGDLCLFGILISPGMFERKIINAVS